jgi:hypothetical protein
MKRIKIFSKFNENKDYKPNLRMPEEVSKEDWNRKLQTFQKAEFTKLEKEFFKRFRDVNIVSSHPILPKHYFVITINDPRGFYLGQIEIMKLDDEWYLISKGSKFEGTKFYICDGWEEVVGYLTGSEYNFIIL